MKSKAIKIMAEVKFQLQFVGNVKFYGFSAFLKTLKSTFQIVQNLMKVFRQGYCNLQENYAQIR
jgi:hypothetical protein